MRISQSDLIDKATDVWSLKKYEMACKNRVTHDQNKEPVHIKNDLDGYSTSTSSIPHGTNQPQAVFSVGTADDIEMITEPASTQNLSVSDVLRIGSSFNDSFEQRWVPGSTVVTEENESMGDVLPTVLMDYSDEIDITTRDSPENVNVYIPPYPTAVSRAVSTPCSEEKQLGTRGKQMEIPDRPDTLVDESLSTKIIKQEYENQEPVLKNYSEQGTPDRYVCLFSHILVNLRNL